MQLYLSLCFFLLVFGLIFPCVLVYVVAHPFHVSVLPGGVVLMSISALVLRPLHCLLHCVCWSVLCVCLSVTQFHFCSSVCFVPQCFVSMLSLCVFAFCVSLPSFCLLLISISFLFHLVLFRFVSRLPLCKFRALFFFQFSILFTVFLLITPNPSTNFNFSIYIITVT